MRVEKDFEEFIRLLNEKKVNYLIVGAFAVAFHARPRFTGDLDFFIDNKSRNIQKLLNVLTEFGFGSLGLSEHDFDGDSVVQLGFEPNRIDLLTDISGISFDAAYTNKVKGRYGNENAFYISLDDLITNKKASDRLKDRSDLELLNEFKKNT